MSGTKRLTKAKGGKFVVANRPSFYNGMYHQEYKLFYETRDGHLTTRVPVGEVYGSRVRCLRLAQALNCSGLEWEPFKVVLPWTPRTKVGIALRKVERAALEDKRP